MSNESSPMMQDKMNEELEKIFRGQSSLNKEQFKQALDGCRKNCEAGRGRNRGGMMRGGPMFDEAKQKMFQILDDQLNELKANDHISKDQVKSALASINWPTKEQRRMMMDQQMQAALKEEFNKLNVEQVNATQAREILRQISRRNPPPPERNPSDSSMIDDRLKDEFMQDFKAKHGNNKIAAEDVWEMVKCCDKKHHERKVPDDQDREKRWDEAFNEQYKELFGDSNKTNLNQQQLEDLAKKIREKLRAQWHQHSGKRFCQH